MPGHFYVFNKVFWVATRPLLGGCQVVSRCLLGVFWVILRRFYMYVFARMFCGSQGISMCF